MTRFDVGARVRTRERTAGHTRLPGYLASKRGVVVAHLGAFVFPDAYVRDPKLPQASELYTIAFDASDVFGRAEHRTIHADLFAEYLEADR